MVDGLHPEGSCTSMVKTRKEWYILGNVKLAEAIVSEPCKCNKYISKLDFAKVICARKAFSFFFTP